MCEFIKIVNIYNMLSLISPAKTLDFETRFNVKKHSLPIFEKEVGQLVGIMKKVAVADLERVFGVSRKLAELNFLRFKNFSREFNLDNSRPALLAFDGDVYGGIDRENYDWKDFDFVQKHLRILSGLYGLLRPLDLIQPYRLEMGVDFKKFDASIKNLAEFWSDKIAAEINLLEGKAIVNLASEEYFAAVDVKKIKAKITNVVFKDEKNGRLKIIGINAKKARGLMVDFIVRNRVDEVGELRGFEGMGYKFEKGLSGVWELVFVRG